MDLTCSKCTTVTQVPDRKIPIGRSYFLCPNCNARINLFIGLRPGTLVTNLVGVRFLRETGEFHEEYCEPGELWRVVNVTQPCPDQGGEKACELNNKGRCPNQRLLVRLERNGMLYRTCLYRNGRRVFDKTARVPVGVVPVPSPTDDDTYRIR